MMKITQGSYVEIEIQVLTTDKRAPQIPQDTKETPLTMRVKGFIQHDGQIGQIATIKTSLGRQMEGTLISDNPRYQHDFGDIVPELFKVRENLKNFIKTGDENG